MLSFANNLGWIILGGPSAYLYFLSCICEDLIAILFPAGSAFYKLNEAIVSGLLSTVSTGLLFEEVWVNICFNLE